MSPIFEKVKLHSKQNLPFVIYRKPNSRTIVGVFQVNDHLYFSENFKEEAFIFSSFLDDKPIVFPIEDSEIKFAAPHLVEASDEKILQTKTNESEREKFISLVQSGINAINDGAFRKVVLSRVESVDVPNFDLEAVFERMLQHYSTAFCYCWYHPKVGMWMGATPEKLLQAKEKSFNTMSLAGTQAFQGNDVVFWKNKEREEQEFVTSFIVENLKNEASDVQLSTPYTTRAGNLLHIRTDIEGKLNEDSNLKNVIDILHPTPAVCGLPKNIARDFILENEGYDREFYTGFLGELNLNINTNEHETDLYVNLRCMKVGENVAQIYVGGGITKDSNPEAEWEETVNKTKTMKRIL